MNVEVDIHDSLDSDLNETVDVGNKQISDVGMDGKDEE